MNEQCFLWFIGINKTCARIKWIKKIVIYINIHKIHDDFGTQYM
jgi:hypothetical protein